MSDPTVVKIGGSTLGAEDTTFSDIVALHESGQRPVVVHGGGALIDGWLDRLGVRSDFVQGLRATSAEALEIVVAVLRGVVNTQLVARIGEAGGRATGLSGVDGAMLRAERYDERLGFVGRITSVDTNLLGALIDAGSIPVIAPIGIEPPDQPLNINADTVAGEVAHALRAARLIFLTNVDGLLDADGHVLPVIDAAEAGELRRNGAISGGMIPKVEACFRAVESGAVAYIANGRQPGTLRRIVAGEPVGTRIGG